MKIPSRVEHLPKHPFWKIAFLKSSLILLFYCGFNLNSIIAEGSKDFENYPGYRLFMDTREDQQFHVFANEGEFINVGASHVGILNGFIKVYRPDGTLASTFDGTGAQNEAIIFNNVQESNGPTGGGSNNGSGYMPGVVAVDSGEAGIWTIEIDYPDYQLANFTNLMNNDPWTRSNNQPISQRVILAWDVTVTTGGAGNENGIPQEGRLYSNEYTSIINLNGNLTSPTFYVMTKGGFIYQVDFMDTDPFRFPMTASSNGFVTHDFQPTYASQHRDVVIRSDDPTTWEAGEIYYYEPQAQDYTGGYLVNNKIFFNPPDPNMPATATVTDIFRNNTYTTWLFETPISLDVEIIGFQVNGTNDINEPCSDDVLQEGLGGNILFNSTLGGTAILRLDLNNDGDFGDDVDRIIYKIVDPGNAEIYWDGHDGNGVMIPIQDDFTFNYDMQMRGGETHVILEDVENNLGGVTFSLYNDNLPVANTDLFYFDHSILGGGISGNGTPGNPQSTSTPYTYQNNFGNDKLLDYWTYIPYNGNGVGSFVVEIAEDCIMLIPADSDGDMVMDAVDLDDDNDGVPDKKEFCNPDGSFDCLPGGMDPSGDEDGDMVSNFEDADDPALSHGCLDNNADGICDTIDPAYDIDGDGIPDHLDLDSDNDGITDLVEGGHGQIDANGNGRIDGPPAEFGANGLYNPIASDPDAPDATETYDRFDKDKDLVPDHDDLDSDNDGINDVGEAGYSLSDTNNDGRIDDGNGNPPLVGNEGLAPILDPKITLLPIPLPPDTDGDNIPNWHDLDSDNDLIRDVEEGLKGDPDDDGIVGIGIPTVDTNGKAIADANGDALETFSNPWERDFDGVFDYLDLDTDNDGINDVVEGGGQDPDNDGIAGIGNPTVDVDGIPISDILGTLLTATSLPPDTDNDQRLDYRDADSDNDGINDVVEGGNPDDDGDAVIGTGEPIVNQNGQAVSDPNGNVLSTNSNPTHSDNDNVPDFRDLDSDDDGIHDIIETNMADPDFDGIIGTGDPFVGFTGQAFNDITNTLLETTSNPTDTDGDNTPDFQEIDSDDDGIPDNDECPDDTPCIDGDNDGWPDFQDTDRDDDGINDADECETGMPCVDTDNDGIPDVDDLDTDGDGILDAAECLGGAPCPDSNNNGIPDWREFTCNPTILVPTISNITGDGEFCEGATVALSASNQVVVQGQIDYTWTGPNGFSFSGTAPPEGPFPVDINNIEMGQAGIFNLTLYSEEGCPSEVESVNIAVTEMPAAPEISVVDADICSGEMIELSTTNYNDPNVTYEWYFDDGTGPISLGTTQFPTYTVTESTSANDGFYMVSANVSDCQSAMSVAENVNIITISEESPDLLVSNNAVCEGEMLELSTAPYQGNVVTYYWLFDNGGGSVSLGITSEPNFSIEIMDFDDVGTYSLIVQIDNCTSLVSNEQIVEVSTELDSAPQLFVADDVFCEGETLELNSSIYQGLNIMYEWHFDDGNGPVLLGTTDIPTYFIDNLNPANQGNYTVTVNIGNCHSQHSNAQDIIINNEIEGALELSVLNDVVCEGGTLELNSSVYPGMDVLYQWYIENSNGLVWLATTNIPTFFVNNMAFEDEGNYTVIATIGNCATAPSNAQNISVTNELEDAPTLAVADDILCENETLELNSSIYPGNNVVYQWYFDDGNTTSLIGATASPTFFIDNVNTSNIGVYYVVANIGNCVSQPSNSQDIQVNNQLDDAPILTAVEDVICEGGTLELNSSIYPGSGVVYQWYFDNGSNTSLIGITAVPTLFLPNLTSVANGTYTVTANIGNCISQPSNAQDIIITNELAGAPELNVVDDVMCEGETLVLNSSVYIGTDVFYEWFVNDGNGPISMGVTNIPTFFLDNLSIANSGIYTVVANMGNCSTQASNAVNVEVNNILDGVLEIVAMEEVLCEGNTLELNTTSHPTSNVEYQWYFDDGNGAVLIASTNLPTLFIDDVSMANTGVYMVVAALGNCQTALSNAQDVLVTNQLDSAPEISVEDDVLCSGQTLELNSSVFPGPGVVYEWFFDDGNGPVSVGTSNNPSFFLDNISPSVSGLYSATANIGNCTSQQSNSIDVSVISAPDLLITNGADINNPACQGDIVQLSVNPIQGATYEWIGPLGFYSTNPNPIIDNISPEMAGDYIVTISTASCTFSTPPASVYVFDDIEAEDDFYNVAFNQILISEDITANDALGNVADWTVTILEEPSNGTVTVINGLIDYTPRTDYSGIDQFTYEICNDFCPDRCAQATVNLMVSNSDILGECFIPNIMTPNNDGLNDSFKVPCLETDYPNNSVKIFNRWGDKVYETLAYQNDWDAKYRGQDLPPGTYYYLIWLDADNANECMQGYFTITR